MSSRSKNRILIFIVAALLISNIAMLVFFLYNNPKGPERNEGNRKPGYGMAETLKKDAGFDAEQIKSFEQLREQHWQKIKPMFQDLQNTKSSFYQLVRDSTASDSVINAAAVMIGEKQKTIDLQIFQHFRQTRNLCRPDQKPKFDSLYQGIVRRMSGQRGGGPGGQHKPDSTRNK